LGKKKPRMPVRADEARSRAHHATGVCVLQSSQVKDRSTNSRRSPVGKLTSNEFGFLPTANETSARSNDLVSCEAPKKTFFASMCKISAASPTSVVVAFKSEPKEISFKADPFLFHSRSIANPSFDELMFLACLSEFEPELSMRLPATLHWKCQRPLRALRAGRKTAIPTRTNRFGRGQKG